MRKPDTAVLEVQPVTGEQGDGYRLYSSLGHLYEARATDDVETRAYKTDVDTWNVRLRYPVTEEAEAYEHVDDLTTMVDEVYDTDLSMSSMEFHQTLKEQDGLTVSDDGITVRYTPESSFSLPDGRPEKIGAGVGAASEITGIALTGAGMGTAVGAAGGPFGMGLGTLIGGTLGGMVGLMHGIDLQAMYKMGEPSRITKLGYDSAKKLKKRKYMKDGMTRGRKKLIEQYNEKNLLEQDMEQNNHLDYADRFDALEEKNIPDKLKLVLEAQFYGFDQRQGVIAQQDAMTYEDARAFIDNLCDVSLDEDAPSLYNQPDVFRSIFKQFADHDLTAEQEVMVWNALEEDNQAVLDYLKDEHPDLLDEAGFDYATGGDT